MFIVDNCNPERRGMLWANDQIGVNKKRAIGEFVMILDDDGYLLDDTFVDQVEKIVSTEARMIIIKSAQRRMANTFPRPAFWGQNRIPAYGKIDSPSTIVRNNLFQKYADRYGGKKQGGDYRFIRACFREVLQEFHVKQNPTEAEIKALEKSRIRFNMGIPEDKRGTIVNPKIKWIDKTIAYTDVRRKGKPEKERQFRGQKKKS